MLVKDKVCIIVGAASPRGIGYATLELFAKHGAKVVAVDLTMGQETLSAMEHQFQSTQGYSIEILGIACDITSKESCESMVSQVLSKFGCIDALINCAAVVQSKALLEIEDRELSLMLDVNLKGALNLAKTCLKIFQQQHAGSLVNVASVAAQRGGGLVGGAHYAASKGGVISLTKTIAREFGEYGIRANVICPSMTETGMIDGMDRAQYDSIVSAIPLKRAGKASDVAGACLFLASELSEYITGATLDVNGGRAVSMTKRNT